MGISAAEYQRLQQRLGGRGKREREDAKPGKAVDPQPAIGIRHRRLLGVDPSLRGTGFGIIEWSGKDWRFVSAGTLRCPASWLRSRCLAAIAVGIRDAIRCHAPDACAVEGLFFAQNLRTALTMGEARGAGLAVIAEAGLPIYELAPRQVKQAIVGFGGAQKLAVAKMVQRRLSLETIPDPDAADALALALAFVQTSSGGIPGLNRLKPL